MSILLLNLWLGGHFCRKPEKRQKRVKKGPSLSKALFLALFGKIEWQRSPFLAVFGLPDPFLDPPLGGVKGGLGAKDHSEGMVSP